MTDMQMTKRTSRIMSDEEVEAHRLRTIPIIRKQNIRIFWTLMLGLVLIIAFNLS